MKKTFKPEFLTKDEVKYLRHNFNLNNRQFKILDYMKSWQTSSGDENGCFTLATKQISDALNLTKITVNRDLNSLRSQGVIESTKTSLKGLKFNVNQYRIKLTHLVDSFLGVTNSESIGYNENESSNQVDSNSDKMSHSYTYTYSSTYSNNKINNKSIINSNLNNNRNLQYINKENNYNNVTLDNLKEIEMETTNETVQQLNERLNASAKQFKLMLQRMTELEDKIDKQNKLITQLNAKIEEIASTENKNASNQASTPTSDDTNNNIVVKSSTEGVISSSVNNYTTNEEKTRQSEEKGHSERFNSKHSYEVEAKLQELLVKAEDETNCYILNSLKRKAIETLHQCTNLEDERQLKVLQTKISELVDDKVYAMIHKAN